VEKILYTVNGITYFIRYFNITFDQKIFPWSGVALESLESKTFQGRRKQCWA
jgi:hypothetical protein